MDYEKKYKEALENARQEYNTTENVERKQWLEELFPELKESEDDRIRKWLIELIEEIRKANPTNADHNGMCSEAIAWLEKQKQKPADKVEPKFKVGDYVVGKYISGYITEVRDDCYLLDYQGFSIDKQDNYHLWTINDAKDGDVLADDDNNVIGIFDGIEGLCWHSKFYYGNITKQLYGMECGGSHIIAFAKPATKEQRDLLFQKMKEDGYEWDAEKKELKKM